MKTSINISFFKKTRLLDTFYPSSFWLKTLKIPSTLNRKFCSPAAALVRHLLALGTAAVFSFLSSEQKWGEEPTCPQRACQQRGRADGEAACFPALSGWWRGGCTCDQGCWTWKPWQGRGRTGKCRKEFCRHLVSPGSSGSSWCSSDLAHMVLLAPMGNTGWWALPFWQSWVHQLPCVRRWLLVWIKLSIWDNSCQIMALMLVVNLLLLERTI